MEPLRSKPRRRYAKVAYIVMAVALLAVPLRAQKGAPSGSGGGGRSGGTPPTARSSGGTPSNYPSGIYGQPSMQRDIEMPPITAIQPFPKPTVVEDETCLPWDLSQVRGATVSVMRLEVPSKARGEFEKACVAFKKKKLEEAEQHVRSAIDKFPRYVAAWVILGQVLEEQHKGQEAREACSHATTVDPTYLPPYLCSAEFSVRDRQWEEVLNLANLAVGLTPIGDGYAYYYRAMAYFHMDKFLDAQRSALQAAGIDRDHHNVALYFLLAQIYEAEGDAADATAQLRQFLKFNKDQQKEDEAKQYLAKLEPQQVTK